MKTRVRNLKHLSISFKDGSESINYVRGEGSRFFHFGCRAISLYEGADYFQVFTSIIGEGNVKGLIFMKDTIKNIRYLM